jgi:voltage-gated potassium channel
VLYRLRGPIVAVVCVVAVATVCYVAIEGFGWIDALYMTVITLATVGYGEVRPLDTSGRFVTIAVIVAGFAVFVYAATVLANFFTSGEASSRIYERRVRRMQTELHDHVIVVGFGRVGQAVVAALRAMGRPCAVVDIDSELGAAIAAADAIHVAGDATDEEVLQRAGIMRAAGLVACADQDSLNLVIVLTARAEHPDLRIVSRVNQSTWLSRMQNAGADVAQSPYVSYGASLAASALSPVSVDLHDLPLLGLGTEEIAIEQSSPLVGAEIAELVETFRGVHILGLRRDQLIHKWHEIGGPLQPHDVLLALGEPAHLAALARASVTPARDVSP